MIEMSEYKYYETVEYYLTYSELIRAARHRGTVTYQEIADLVGLPMRGSYMGSEVGHLLGAVSANEVRNGRPMLSAIAVGVSGRPGEGFYPFARQLGRHTEDTEEAALYFWEEEKKAVYATWQKEFKRK